MGRRHPRDNADATGHARHREANREPDPAREGGRPRPSLVSSTFLTFATQVASSVFALANVFVIARTLGPTGRGEVVFLMAISQILSRLGAFGVQEANINFASAEPELRPALATNSVIISFVLGGFVAGGTAALASVVPLFGSGLRPSLVALALASLPLLLLKTYLWRFIQADYRFGIASVSWTLPFVANFAANGALALAGALSVTTAFLTWAGAQVVPVGFLAWHVARRLGGFGAPSLPLARRALKFGVQTHIYQVMSIGNLRLDQWILGGLGNTRELGLYSVAVSLSSSLYQLPAALDLAQRPDLVRVSKTEAARRASMAFRVAVVSTGALAAAMAIFAPWICVGVFGSRFRGSVDDLRVLMLGAVGVVAIKLLGNALTAQRRPLLVSVGVAAGLVVTIVLDVLLIPRYGGLGAAIASVIAYSTAGGVLAVIFVRTLGGRAADLIPRPGDGSLLVAQARRLIRPRTARPSAPAGGDRPV